MEDTDVARQHICSSVYASGAKLLKSALKVKKIKFDDLENSLLKFMKTLSVHVAVMAQVVHMHM